MSSSNPQAAIPDIKQRVAAQREPIFARVMRYP